MSNGSSNCSKCVEWKGKVTKLEETVAFIEAKTRDCVRAYKTVLKEKNVILHNFEELKELFAKRVDEEERRLATLEDNLNELSSICGKYEAENVKKQMVIDQLNQRCDELTQQLASYESNNDSPNLSDPGSSIPVDQVKQIPVYMNKWTQTVIVKEEKDEKTEIQSSNKDQETQTSCQDLLTVKQKKTECAIVLPTHREVEKSINVDSRRGSHGSNESGTETVFTDSEVALNENESRPFESIRPSLNSQSNSVSLFYVNELARKEIELVETRLTARENECALRELRWKYNVDTFKLQSKLTRLEQQLQQLQNDDTTKPNLTYIRNVLNRFVKTKDKKQRNCMMNALLAAVGIDQKEIKT